MRSSKTPWSRSRRRPPLAGLVFILAGALHFRFPKVYRQIMPPYVPWPQAMVLASGVAELGGGVGLLIPRSRNAASWWLVATLVAVFPANLHMALHADEFPRVPGGRAALWARLPLQGLFIAWVRRAARG